MTVKDRLLVLETKVKDILLLVKWQIGLTSIILAAMLAAWKVK
jgi:hypothetical protein